jgi:hypothetical protein
MTRISFVPLYQSTLGFDKFFDDVEKLLTMDIQKSTLIFPTQHPKTG